MIIYVTGLSSFYSNQNIHPLIRLLLADFNIEETYSFQLHLGM